MAKYKQIIQRGIIDELNNDTIIIKKIDNIKPQFYI